MEPEKGAVKEDSYLKRVLSQVPCQFSGVLFRAQERTASEDPGRAWHLPRPLGGSKK